MNHQTVVTLAEISFMNIEVELKEKLTIKGEIGKVWWKRSTDGSILKLSPASIQSTVELKWLEH